VASTATCAASDNNTLEDEAIPDAISYATGATSPGEDADVADAGCHICILTKKILVKSVAMKPQKALTTG